jgi:hypothetical protein
MPFAAIAQRIRSFSLSIGQLTFASFMLLLAMIVMTSVASVVAIRHTDATFAELQRLQSVDDLAEEIDRRMNELRLAARDFVTDPAIPSSRVWEAAASLTPLLKKTGYSLAAGTRTVRSGDRQGDRPRRREQSVSDAKQDCRGVARARSDDCRAVCATHAVADD